MPAAADNPPSPVIANPRSGCGNPFSPSKPPSLVQKWGIQWGRSPLGREEGSASLFAEIRRSSLWSLLEDSGETSFSNRNDMFRFEEEEPPSDTEFSQYHGSAETERATCVPTRFPLAVSFPRFFSAKRNGVAPQREKPPSCSRLSSPPQRANSRPRNPLPPGKDSSHWKPRSLPGTEQASPVRLWR